MQSSFVTYNQYFSDSKYRVKVKTIDVIMAEEVVGVPHFTHIYHGCTKNHYYGHFWFAKCLRYDF